MKMKIVVRVSMDDYKSRSKALKISVSISGVESAAVKGDTLEVTGEGVDAVELMHQLRKKMSQAELVSVGEVKKEEKPPAPAPAATGAKSVAPEVNWVPVYPTYPPYAYSYNTYPVPDPAPGCGCAIM